MNTKSIEILVLPSGEIQVEAVGFHGADCEKATAFLTQMLGKITHSNRKPEYYQRIQIKERQQVGK